MAANLLALVRGIAISIIIMQAAIAAVMWLHAECMECEVGVDSGIMD